MASPPDQPWSNHEKNYLLAEIIKAANPPAEVLLNVLRNLRIDPQWNDISLPHGRSLNASRFAYDTMQNTLPAHSMSMSMPSQTPMTLPTPTLKRPLVPAEAPYLTAGREIRPKPLMGAPGYSHPSPTEPPPKRKRGRPTKAEQQAKADAAAAAGMSFDTGMARPIPPRSSSLMPMPPHSAGPSPVPEEVKPMLPPTTRMPIAAMLTPTARETKSVSNSSSSSGKKRRRRSAKSEREGTPTARSRNDLDSPQELRAAPVPDDSPARTAVLRHREETVHPIHSLITQPDPPPRPRPESGHEQQQQQQPPPPSLQPQHLPYQYNHPPPRPQ